MLYETADHLAAEAEVIKKFCNQFNLKFYKLPIKYQLDYMLTNKKDKIKAMAEIKVRKFSKDQFNTLILSLDKFERGVSFTKNFFVDQSKPLPFLILLRLTDCDCYYNHNPQRELDIRWGGLNKLRRASDVEPVVHIPISLFKDF